MSNTVSKIKVVLADDHKLIMDCLKTILESEYDVVATAATGVDLIECIEKFSPDVVVTDISMPMLNGIEAIRQMTKNHPQIKVVFLTMHPEVDYALRAFAAGASGYVLKSSAASELLLAIQEAISGRTYVTPLIAGRLIQAYQEGATSTDDVADRLTPRQREILQLISEGKCVKDIAKLLELSTRTVESHKYSMMKSLGLSNLGELMQFAYKHGPLN